MIRVNISVNSPGKYKILYKYKDEVLPPVIIILLNGEDFSEAFLCCSDTCFKGYQTVV